LLNERAQSTGAEQITQALAQSSQTAPQIVETLRQWSQAVIGLHCRFKLEA